MMKSANAFKESIQLISAASRKIKASFVVRVIELHRFEKFVDLYALLPLLKCGYTSETISSATSDDMNQYYSGEKQSRHGVIGIEIELI